jgi:F420-dependent oxidoreductase-like protein
MQLRVFAEPQQGPQQGWTYDDVLRTALVAEEEGFDGFFRSDHYLDMHKEGGGVPPGSTDAWITLAGLARDTSRIRLGTLMSASTFRLPGVLAVMASQVDQMSGGRLELGLGAGWSLPEHEAYGIPFPATGRERRERWEEQLEIITGFMETPAGETFSFAGSYYSLKDCPALPKPTQRPRFPIIVGGSGLTKTPGMAARYADEFNVNFVPIDHLVRSYQALDEACDAIGRDRSTIRRSCARFLCCGVDKSEVERRAARLGKDLDDLRARGITGTPDEAVEALTRYAAIGVSRVYLQVIDLEDMDHLRLVAREVLPRVKDL